jgi:hypothetical protein
METITWVPVEIVHGNNGKTPVCLRSGSTAVRCVTL